MNKLEFATKEEFKLYLKKNIVKRVGDGSEGTCFLLKDGSALKVYGDLDSDYEPYYHSKIDDIKLEGIIMYNDVNIENFLFPEQLLLVAGKLRAYKTKFVANNRFGNYLSPQKIDFEKLIEAYYDFLEKTLIISKKSISYYDLPFNLIFNNKKLYAIDTIEYIRKENVLEDSIKSLRNAISEELNYFIERASILAGNMLPEEKTVLKEGELIEEYVSRVRSELEKYIDPHQFIKR